MCLPITVRLSRLCLVGDRLKSALHLYSPENTPDVQICIPKILQKRHSTLINLILFYPIQGNLVQEVKIVIL